MPRNAPPRAPRRFPGARHTRCPVTWDTGGGCQNHTCGGAAPHPNNHQCKCGAQLAQVDGKEWQALGCPSPPNLHRSYNWDKELGWVSQCTALERSDYGVFGLHDVTPYVPFGDVYGSILGFIDGWRTCALEYCTQWTPDPGYADIRDFLRRHTDIKYEHACHYALRIRSYLGQHSTDGGIPW